jgi:ferredoxin
MKVSVNKGKCVGCGACVSACPDVFELEDGKAVVKEKETDKGCVKEAEEACPVDAISIS